VINPEKGGMSVRLAQHVLALGLCEADRHRFKELSDKAQDAKLTAGERSELEEYLDALDFLAILKSKARVSLRQYIPAASP